MSLEFFIARRYFTSRHRQGFISFLGFLSIFVVMLSTASLLIVLSVMNGFEMEVRSRIIGTMAHILVQHRVADAIEDWEDLREQIRQVDGVVATSPVVIEKAAISSRSGTDGILVRGIIPQAESAVTEIAEYLLTKDLNFDTVDDKYKGVWMGINLAARLNVSINDKIRLYSLKNVESDLSGFSPKIKPCMVTGIVETGMSTYDDNFVYICLNLDIIDSIRINFHLYKLIAVILLAGNKELFVLNEVKIFSLKRITPASFDPIHLLPLLSKSLVLECSTLILHGVSDEVVPFDWSKKVAQNSPNTVKLYPLDGDHRLSGLESKMWALIRSFLEKSEF